MSMKKLGLCALSLSLALGPLALRTGVREPALGLLLKSGRTLASPELNLLSLVGSGLEAVFANVGEVLETLSNGLGATAKKAANGSD